MRVQGFILGRVVNARVFSVEQILTPNCIKIVQKLTRTAGCPTILTTVPFWLKGF